MSRRAPSGHAARGQSPDGSLWSETGAGYGGHDWVSGSQYWVVWLDQVYACCMYSCLRFGQSFKCLCWSARSCHARGGAKHTQAPLTARRPQIAGGHKYLPPRQDASAPDLYIPLMAACTYCVLASVAQTAGRRFKPDTMYATVRSGLLQTLTPCMPRCAGLAASPRTMHAAVRGGASPAGSKPLNQQLQLWKPAGAAALPMQCSAGMGMQLLFLRVC